MALLTAYTKKLKNPKWQKKRLEVLQRDGFTCLLCNSTEYELHVHHRSYETGKEPWEYPIDNFQTLCLHCHVIVEHFKKEAIHFKESDIVEVMKQPIRGFPDHLGVLVRYKSESFCGVAFYRFHLETNKYELVINISDDTIHMLANFIS